MNSKVILPILICLFASLLSACGKLDAPVSGTYRAYVKLRGGEVPFELQVSSQSGKTALGILQDGELRPATKVVVSDGVLQAQLPDAMGALQVTLGRSDMKGELRITDPQGKVQVLPFAAELGKPYRFMQQAKTDNTDVSGYWQLEAISPEHFSAPVTLQLTQRFDVVDGRVQLRDGKIMTVLGQTNGDEVYLSLLGQGRAVLLKGKVNAQGELVGELWTNLSNARTWVAKRMVDASGAAVSAHDEQLRKVAFPWAIPAS
jgi:hypothetical protein